MTPWTPFTLGRHEAAAALRISVNHLDRLRARGVLRAVRLGRRVVFDADWLREDYRRHVTASASAQPARLTRRRQSGEVDLTVHLPDGRWVAV